MCNIQIRLRLVPVYNCDEEMSVVPPFLLFALNILAIIGGSFMTQQHREKRRKKLTEHNF